MADSSPNPYIRTYAKDMASASGDAAAPPVPEKKGTQTEREAVLARLRNRTQPEEKKPAPEPAVVAPVPPPTTSAPAPKSPEDHPHLLELPAHTVSSEPPPISSPLPPLPIMPAPIPEHPPVEPPAPPPAPAFVPPAAPVPPPAPVFEAIPVLIPKTPRIEPPAPAPLPEPTPAPAPTASPLHTYSSDFADRVDTQSASAFSVLAAESDAGTAVKKVRRLPSKGLVMTVAGIILVALGGTGLYGAYRYMATHQSVSLAPQVASLIFADDRQALEGEGTELLEAIAASAETALPSGQVRVLYLTESTTTSDGTPITQPLAGGQLIGSLQLAAPDMLLRNIAPESTVGIVHAGAETRAFFIVRVLSYERTFAGMLEWERVMQNALAPLYPLYPVPAPPPPTIATTTKIVSGKKVVATTTVEAAPVFVAAPHFVDEVASNHDVRALKDGQGRTILLYGYKDKETLIIARDESAFAELIRRLAATKQQ
jgi:hypothetical protein